MSKHELPPFLRGSFVWSMQGFFHAQPSTVHLLEPDSLESDNPWIVIAAAVEQAKHGNHTHIRRLQRWFHAGHEGFPDQTCICVTGDAGTESDLRALLPLMTQGPDQLRAHACQAASLAGRLWLVPFMLQAYERAEVPGERETIGFAMADLLDEEFGGPVASQVGSCQINVESATRIANPQLRALALRQARPENEPSTFATQVTTRCRELNEQMGSDNMSLWQGKPFDIARLATSMLELTRHDRMTLAPAPAPAPYGILRRKFEGHTGINCSSFFRNGVFQPLAAAVILENFLESGDARAYEEGQRYFFGHRVPD